MPWLLDAAYLLVVALASPLLLYRRVRFGKYRDGWKEKLFGLVPELPAGRERVWFHAVSVGEAVLLREPVRQFRERRPDVEVVVTATTPTGLDVARRQFPDLTVCYCPLDFSWATRRAVRRLRPTLLVLVELELWPNLIAAADAAGAKLAVVNGRLSEKSFRGYRRLRPLVRPLLGRFDLIAAQSDDYARRFLALGAPAERVVVTGSVKFDGVRTDRDNPETDRLRRAFGLRPDEPAFIAGSTQHPEEEFALAAWRSLRERFPSLRLLLVPRHKERFEEVAALVRREGLPLLRRTETTSDHEPPTADRSPVLLLDTLGELGACWGLADVAFVGGSLTSRGGQNMLEPAGYGAAVLFGPNTWNFKDVVALLTAADAVRVVRTGEDLTAAIGDLLADESARRDLGAKARAVVLAHRGATARTVDLLADLLPPAAARKAA